MAQIATTTNTTPFQFPSNTLFDRNPVNGHLLALVKASTADNYTVYRSTDLGATWSSLLVLVRASLVELGSIFCDNFGWLHWCYRTNESSQDRVYYRRLNLNATTLAWEAEVLTGNPANGGVAGAIHTGLDLMLVLAGGQGYVAIAAGTTQGASIGVTFYGVHISAGGVRTYNNSLFATARQWLHTGAGRITPSLDIEHTGDGKGANVPHLWCVWGRTRLFAVKCSWKGNGWWTPASPVELFTAGARDSVTARWDGSRMMTVVPHPTAGLTDRVLVIERDAANSTTTLRVSNAHTTGVVRQCAANYNNVNGDLRVYAVGTSTGVLYFCDYIRASNTWTAWATVLATAILGANVDNWGVRRGSAYNAKYDVYTAHAASVLTHTAQAQTYTPNAPTWVAGTVSHGQAANVGAALTLDWVFNDPDPNDTQSAYAVSKQVGAGALSYWRASDSTWQVAEVQNTSATTSLTIPSGWGVHTDEATTFKVKTWDSAGVASVYSDGFVVIPSTPVDPVITSPAHSSTYTEGILVVQWTATEQTAYRIRHMIFTEVLADTGVVFDSVTREWTSPFPLTDTFNYSVQLWTYNNEGLISVMDQNDFAVDFIEPATPSLVAQPDPGAGHITIVITNPTPGGGQPAVAFNDVYRRDTGDTGHGEPIATGIADNGLYNDWKAASGKGYEYRVITTGVNGTVKASFWTP